MKIIFLDVDGVLNNTRTAETFEDYIFVSDEKIELLKEIVDKTDAKIVLSSSWRRGWQAKDNNPRCAHDEVRLFNAFELKLGEHGLHLMGYTPHLWHRGKEIARWLEDWTGESIESFVILDDLDKEFLKPHSNRLIQTKISEGLTKDHVEQAVSILNSNLG